MTLSPVQPVNPDELEDGPPPLVGESDDEDWRQHGENLSECSSADTENAFEFLLHHYEADKNSDMESSEDDITKTGRAYGNQEMYR